MGDVDEGDPEILLHGTQLAAHADAQMFVERRKRFVEKQHARLGDGGARQSHTLLLTARELARKPVGEFGQPHLFDHLVGLAVALGL